MTRQEKIELLQDQVQHNRIGKKEFYDKCKEWELDWYDDVLEPIGYNVCDRCEMYGESELDLFWLDGFDWEEDNPKDQAILKSLNAAPQTVGGKFDCSTNFGVGSLEGMPQKVDSVICSYTFIKTLEGAPDIITGNFDCSCNPMLYTLEGGPERVGKDFICRKCGHLIILEGAPKYVGNNFDCQSCSLLLALYGAPNYVKNNFDCSSCEELRILKCAPKYVGGNFNCSECK